MDYKQPDRESLVGRIAELEQQLDQLLSERSNMLSRFDQYLHDIYNNAGDLIFIINNNGDIVYTNPSFRFKVGYTENEILQCSFEEIVHIDYQTNLKKLLREIEGQTSRTSLILRTKSNKNIYVNGTLSAYMTADNRQMYRGVFFDVSERIRAESFQSLFYSIASFAFQNTDLDKFLDNTILEISRHFQVKHFTVGTLKDGKLEIVYRMNEYSKISNQMEEVLAQYIGKRGKPMIIYEDGLKKILEHPLGQKVIAPKLWLGVPRKDEASTSVVMLYSYDDLIHYNHKDLELLEFISSQLNLILGRKKNEETIAKQDARLQAIFETSSHQIWSINRSYCFTSFNSNYEKSFLNYFGSQPVIGQSIDQVYRRFFDEKTHNFWTQKYIQAFAGNVVNFQTSLIDRKNETIWRDIYLNPIFLPDGTIEEISIIANDITEKKNSEKVILESEEKFRTIFESIQDIYFRCREDGTITMVSPSVKDVLGYDPVEVIGHKMDGFFMSKKGRSLLLHRLKSEITIKNYEGEVKTREGQKISFLCNVRLIIRPDHALEIEGVARDITLLRKTNKELVKAKEMAEKSLKIKERFLANMSHEIRTPMNGVIGMIDLLSFTNLDEEQADYVEVIKKSSHTLLTILNDILDLSKIEAGKMELKREFVNLVELIEKVYSLFSQQSHQNNISLFYFLDDHIPKNVIMDETRLVQVISNLTSNALKFTNSGGDVSISLQMTEEYDTHYTFRVEVKDSGIGIDPMDQKKLFQSFNQLDNSNQKLFAGTGLGLAISKQLVERMSGEIGVVSTPGLGSTFWFTFQAEKYDPEKSIVTWLTEETVDENSETVTKPALVLLVDDNEINRKVAKEILLKSGCEVTLAKSGLEAIKIIEENVPFDLIFMDIQMPEMDGVEALSHIKKIPSISLPPIIAMTAYSMEEDKQRFLTEGFDDYLSKPIRSQLLIEKIKKWTKYSPIDLASQIKLTTPTQQALVINQNTLNQLHKYGGKELIYGVLDEFEIEARQLIDSCEQSYKNSDFQTMREALHTLKGNAGTLGVEQVSNKAEMLEKQIKANKFENLDKEIEFLKKSFDQFQQNLSKLKQSE